jgi:DNA-binding GntR family transcriptional regulator
MDAYPVSSDLIGKAASAYEHLRRTVSHGQLRPGRRLSATGLAAEFRISETPVREALVRLSAEGFLDWRPGKGHFTKPVTLAEQRDLHEVLAMGLELCVGSERRGDGRRSASIALAAPRRSLSDDGAFDADHRMAQVLRETGVALAKSNGNGVLQAIISILLDRTYLIRRLDLDSPSQIAAALSRIERLTSAAKAGDTARATAVVKEHLAARWRRLPDLVVAAQHVVAQSNYP